MNQKGFTPIIVVLVSLFVVGITGVYYFGTLNNIKPQPQNQFVASQTPKSSTTPSSIPFDTSDLKTYTNTKRGFTFKYPANLFVIPGQVDEFVVLSTEEKMNWSTSEGEKMQISIINNPNNLSIQDYYKSLPKVPNTHSFTITFQSISINGYEAAISTSIGCGGVGEDCTNNKPAYEKYIKGNKYIVRFDTESWDDPWVNKLLSSFKFLDQNQTSDVTSEINSFPIYPNAKFIEKKLVPPCIKGSYSGFSICNAKTYTWQIQDPYGKVEDWYKNNSLGWKFSGGAGSRDSLDSNSGGSGKSTYKNGGLSYGLSLGGFPSPTTIILEIPLGPPEGN